MREEFLKLFNQVFDSNGNIKSCGRTTCMQLIQAAMKLDPNANKEYYGVGDSESSKRGFMNVQHIKALHDKIM